MHKIMETKNYSKLECSYKQYKVYKRLKFKVTRSLILPERLHNLGAFKEEHKKTKQFWKYISNPKNFTYYVYVPKKDSNSK